MDFIERIFHVSPDGGSGALEFVYVAILTTATALVVFRRRIRRGLGTRRASDKRQKTR